MSITVTPGSNIRNVTMSRLTGTLAGTITDSFGVAIAGASINFGGSVVTTNSQGQYSYTAIPIGTYDFTASKAGYGSYSTQVVITTGANNKNVTLTATTGSLTGTVNDDMGVLLSGVSVTLNAYTATTDSQGRYSFLDIPVGTYSMTFSKAGFTTVQI